MIFAIAIAIILAAAAAYFLVMYRAFNQEPEDESRYNLESPDENR